MGIKSSISCAIPSWMVSRGANGCLRRVSENRRLSTFGSQSTNRTVALILGSAFNWAIELMMAWMEKSRFRISNPIAKGLDVFEEVATLSIKEIGKLSMVSNSSSSKALIAEDLPAPDGPVTRTKVIWSAVDIGQILILR